jgi:uncharacterized repeat protein (TIGR01451 family)
VGVDQIGNTADIAPAASPTPVRIFVLANVPAAATNGQYASIRLQAQAAAAGSSGATLAVETAAADNPAVVDIVFADAGRDASETADGQYAIQSAALSVSKAVAVISDPFNTTNPKAIPGAVVEYTINIENTGAVAATNLSLTDAIPANTTYLAGSLRRDATTLTDAADADGGQANGAPVTNIAVTIPSIAAAGTSIVRFRVTVQ